MGSLTSLAVILYRVPTSYGEGDVEDPEEVTGIKVINVSKRVRGGKRMSKGARPIEEHDGSRIK